MYRSSIVFGVISGSTAIIGIIATIVFEVAYQWLGYLIMLIAFTAIYIALLRYREDIQGGVMKFATGLKLGGSITGIASLAYVFGWEMYLLVTDYSFATEYMDAVIEAERASGASEAEIATLAADMTNFQESYGNPLFRTAVTFTEIFPVGLLVSLVSATLLRK